MSLRHATVPELQAQSGKLRAAGATYAASIYEAEIKRRQRMACQVAQAMTADLGERVLSYVGAGSNRLRPGVVTAVLEGPFLKPERQYMVRFDGDQGHSGPCLYVQPEPTPE